MGAGDKAHFLLIDERWGRTVASDMGLKVLGLLGALLKARRKYAERPVDKNCTLSYINSLDIERSYIVYVDNSG